MSISEIRTSYLCMKDCTYSFFVLYGSQKGSYWNMNLKERLELLIQTEHIAKCFDYNEFEK